MCIIQNFKSQFITTEIAMLGHTFALLSVFAGAASGEEGSCDSNGSPIRQAAAYVQSFDSYTLTYVHLFNIFHVHEASF